MKNTETIAQWTEKIYELKLIQNKHAGMGFAPDVLSFDQRIETEKAFDAIFDEGDLSKITVDGKDIKVYVKENLLKKNIVIYSEDDLVYYSKAAVKNKNFSQ